MTDFNIENEELRNRVLATKRRVASLHSLLKEYGLVVWTAGNVSERVFGTDFFVIKPSGVSYDELTSDNMVLCDINGRQVFEDNAPNLKPSSDMATHAYVYRHMETVGGVVHTHSNYATAYAMVERAIPCACTMQADEFGGDIPLGPFALIGNDSIGQGIVETLRHSKSRAVLMAHHGPFTIGKNAEDAVKAAIMLEDVARSSYIAETLGSVNRLEEKDIERLWGRYQNVYGQ